MITSLSILLRLGNVSDKAVEKIKTHILLLFSRNHVIYEIMWKNMVEPVPKRGRGSR